MTITIFSMSKYLPVWHQIAIFLFSLYMKRGVLGSWQTKETGVLRSHGPLEAVLLHLQTSAPTLRRTKNISCLLLTPLCRIFSFVHVCGRTRYWVMLLGVCFSLPLFYIWLGSLVDMDNPRAGLSLLPGFYN